MAEFDPQAFLVKTEGVAPPPQVGPKETFALRGSQALPLGSLVSDLLSTGAFLALRPKPGAVIPDAAKAELATMGIQVEEPQTESALDAYRDIRDTRRLRTKAGSEQNPNFARAGTATGIAASIAAPLPKTSLGAVRGPGGAVSMSRAARIGNAALTGGLYGGLSGLTEGESDLTRGDIEGVLGDTLQGAMWGGALGGVAGLGAEAIRPLAGALRRLATEQTRRTIQGGTDVMAGSRVPLSSEAADEILVSGGMKPFSTTQATAARIEELAKQRGDAYGRILDELESLGVQGPRAQELADDIYRRYQAEFPNYVDSKAIPEVFKRISENVREAVGPGPGMEGPVRQSLGLRQTERIKQEMQGLAKYHKVNASPAEETYRELGSTFRQANEDAVRAAGEAAPAGSRLRALADSFEPLKAQLARTLEARHYARPAASKAQQRSPVGIKDYLIGATTGDPGFAVGTAVASGAARNRLPSTIASGSFNLSEGLRTGSLSSELAAALAGGAELLGDEVQSRADRAVIDERTDPISAALIRAMRTRQKRNEKKETR